MAKPSMRGMPARRPARAARQAPRVLAARRAASSARGKSTFYRYRRGIPPAVPRVALALATLALVWWLGAHLETGRAPARGMAAPVHPAAAVHLPTLPSPPPASATPDPALPMAGGPTLTASLVDGILAAYGSPLHGHGKEIVALSRRYGIDDAVALGFFVMESRAGTQGEAQVTRSFGNLRPMPSAPTRDGYRAYRTWIESASEWFSLIRSLYLDNLKLLSVEAVIPIYAPASDNNDPATMIAGIHQLVDCWRGAVDACPDDPPGVRGLVAARGTG